ncbi:Uma2 family endonuclease [Candidatus Poribacteria bacterium]|nr:Uma2 family endonuclease [Candidatus Poribacteria bacterium]
MSAQKDEERTFLIGAPTFQAYQPVRWTSADLDYFPDNGKRYEIINGELFVERQPHWYHQQACTNIVIELGDWNRKRDMGQVVQAPGVIFTDADDVAPDVVWASKERLAVILKEDGHLHGTPELVVEVLSPGLRNEQRDLVTKLKLYSIQGVLEYWIVDWRIQTVAVYRRKEAMLQLVATLQHFDELTSPLLLGFRVSVARLFS